MAVNRQSRRYFLFILTFPPPSPPFNFVFVAPLGIACKQSLPSLNRNADKGRGIRVALTTVDEEVSAFSVLIGRPVC